MRAGLHVRSNPARDLCLDRLGPVATNVQADSHRRPPPRSGSRRTGRHRSLATCPRTSASSSGTCDGPVERFEGSPWSWAEARPRSAANCAATPTRSIATGPRQRTALQCSGRYNPEACQAPCAHGGSTTMVRCGWLAQAAERLVTAPGMARRPELVSAANRLAMVAPSAADAHGPRGQDSGHRHGYNGGRRAPRRPDRRRRNRMRVSRPHRPVELQQCEDPQRHTQPSGRRRLPRNVLRPGALEHACLGPTDHGARRVRR